MRCPKCGERERRTIHPSICREEGGQIVSRPAPSVRNARVPPQSNPGCVNWVWKSIFLLGRIARGFLFTKPKLQRRSLPVAKCENGHKFRGIQYNPSLFFPMIEVVGVAMKYGRPSSNDILIWTICHWRREVTSYMMTIIKPD